MTAREIMTYINEIKENIPDAVYLNLANLLKKQEIKKVDDYTLVEICYITNCIRRGNKDENEEEDYVVYTQFHTKKVYVNKNHNSMKQGKCFDFVNFEGLEVITPETRREKQFYDQSKTENKISVVYEKYILVSIKDC